MSDCDPIASGRRQRGQELCRVEELLQRRRPQHPGLAKQCVDDGVRAGERCGMRRGRSCAGTARPAAHRQNRLRARDPSRNPGELPRIPERFEVEENDVSLWVVLPVLEQVVRRHICLVADRDEARQAEPPRVRLLEKRQPERAALRGERRAAGGEGGSCERRVQPAGRRGDAEAVGPDQPGAVASHERQQLLLPGEPGGAGLGEACRDDADRADPGVERLLRRSENPVTGHTDDREVDGDRNVRDRSCTRPRRPPGRPSG